ncbi:multipass membrane protein [Candidatus Mancarchaeum acidiphilum]|uniref:Multipass membrane protein n=1 Tax=Candidatus Mancarchaeum acidiphilum TaxID=1920749 RepID=A0A218NNE4_9ARCH|nr:hypothetical protein [Candidatus Mancarchaeum acidiphilum]ASI13986.1 multipass membrane protein [Candidatus Mancarchaeum acidiphilum]
MGSLIIGAVTLIIPLVALFISFMFAKLDALKSAFVGFIVELAMVVLFYPSARIVDASIWGTFETYSIFGVIWTGMIFGIMYRETGLLRRLLDVLHSVIHSGWGLVAALGGVIQGILGAFNGFAVYPIAIPGIKELGYEPWRSATGYLVLASWTIPLVSLWIAGSLASAASHIPVPTMAPFVGMITIPLIFIAVFGGMKILNEKFNKENLTIAALYIISGIVSIIVFAILIPSAYLLTLIASGFLTLILFVLYSKHLKQDSTDIQKFSLSGILKPFGPIIVGIVLILLWTYPLAGLVAKANYVLKLWTYAPVSINLLTTPAFFIFVVALSTYMFKIKPDENKGKQKPATPVTKPLGVWSSLVKGSRMSGNSLLTTFLGATFAGVAIASGQVAAITKLMAEAGSLFYPIVLNIFSWGTGIVFATGTVAAFLISAPQVAVASALTLPVGLLLGVVVIMTMGPANPLKPSLIAYTATLAGAPSKDQSKIFNNALVWMAIELVVALITTFVITYLVI